MKVLAFSRALLSRRDCVYLLSLLVPFVVYNLALKAYDIGSQPGGSGLVRTFDLLRSEVFFNLGYVLFWIGLFATSRKGPLRWAVLVLFHTVTVLVVIVNTCAHQYFRETGTTLDYATVARWISRLDEVVPILTRDVPLLAWTLLLAALLYATLGPLLVTRVFDRRRGRPERPSAVPVQTPLFFGPVGLWLLAFGFGSLSLLPGPGTLAGDPFVNLILTGVEEATAGKDDRDADPAAGHPAAHASLAQTPRTEKRNVALIHLESTRAQSATPYNEDVKTMPFLDELARDSLLVERAYVVVPRSSKGSVAVNCGVEPPLYPGPEFEPGNIPAPCLAGLLKEQGYRTVYFQSTSNAANGYWDSVLTRNFGYEEFYPSESMNTEGYRLTNSFGYEEDIMLEPSEKWLSAYGYDGPFLAQYFTGTGHYGYECVPNRYGYEYFSEDEELDRYLNCLRMLDFFLKNLFEQYKRQGLYEDTIFVIYGDHGEGFKEHGRDMHGDTIWDEGLKVPLIIHDPKRFQNGERVEGLSSQLDILPTVLEMLGYEVEGGEYPGYSLLHPLPEDRTLMFSCITTRRCMASIKGFEKYIHHFGERPDEFFDLSEDPLEKHNLADERSKEELDRRREELLEWRSRVNARYAGRMPSAVMNPDQGLAPHVGQHIHFFRTVSEKTP